MNMAKYKLNVAVFDMYAYIKDEVIKATNGDIKKWLAEDENYACSYTLKEYEEYANQGQFTESYIRFYIN